ncbi:succinate dehydrogenase cytochrome b subunit [Lentimicrobium sp.]|jgi:succinate dehydrogenase / fumarate reductase cytochrome b subunit|uniref:succinate dehydrogenase cytochrome b subunit n=1 Tax=Lentimicrobium sp. TaxID=2034841 RepID=UPI0025EC9D68|nr:succinate dehydrogenase cytochrome b subunit [Lentimicrobium sp.]MCO5257896.1 succinate dehydrogenase cytochrome b subunit [Lentimicrobium sp.]HPF63360.1 succinate dehydrogenase cytochrome b subunit [Lentimicrobium sp.]HPJ62199.1 succinate dehydrogenase cytochrome b subunit [Lentimicrobium sp.]HPR25795.1 succinate dehydrogenase cytochrome b subunit [Lentimicrobium sp.]HRW69660.1 succinate dehydrogenase cytochrome b subunit [Lentimicrobium sp.]
MVLKYSSITKKIIMALAGLFLISFLIVHLGINLLILKNDGREAFNLAAHFMVTNPLIQTMQWVLFGGFIIHILLGVVLQIQNWMARPQRYKVEGYSHTSFFSKFMIHTGAIILAFLVLHLINFFFRAKFGEMPGVMIGDQHYEDMGLLVIEKFKSLPYVLIYIFWLLFLGFHLDHAFHSALQSLGLNHNKYTPVAFGISRALAILIAGGFILIPLIIYIS